MTGKILVCSATGKVGKEVVQQLKDAGADLRAASGNVERASGVFGQGVEIVQLSYDDPATWQPALQGVERLFMVHPQDAPGRIEQLRAFVDAAQQVKHVVFMSALGADRRESDEMRLLEKHLQASSMAWTILRPNWFMQNFTTQELRGIREHNHLNMPSGASRLSFVDTRDIAAVAVRALLDDGHAGKEYTPTGDKAYSYGDVARLISEVCGREITHESPSVEQVLEGMRKGGVPPVFVTFMEWLYSDIHEEYTAQITTHIQEVTGRAPRQLTDFVREHANLWKV
jgi:uncharacterized protein YbjT (DUF2867 family)